MDAVDEMPVRLVVAAVAKRQHGNRSFERGLGNRHRRLVEHVVVEYEVDNRERHHCDDDAIQRAAGPVADRFAAVDLALTPDSIRRELVSPREYQCRQETDHEKQEDEPRHPAWQRQQGNEHVHDLHQQPRRYEVGNAHLEDIAALEFSDQPGHPIRLVASLWKR